MTPQQIDAMKLALEALEGCHIYGDLECVMTPDSAIYLHPAITALEEVLAEHAMREVQRLGQEIEQEPLEYWNAVEGWVKIDEVRKHFDSVGCGTIYKSAGEGRVPLCLAQPEQEPVAWLLTDKNINSLQVDSIQSLIVRAKHAHHIDVCVRIVGQDEWFEADWLKHMVRVTPPQRTEEKNT